MEILAFISLIRGSFVGSEYVYTHGSCIKFALMLQKLYGPLKECCDIYWNDKQNHAIFEFGNKFYDITGEVTRTDDYYHISFEDIEERKDVKDLTFRLDLTGYICPKCDEIFAFEEIVKFNDRSNGKT